MGDGGQREREVDWGQVGDALEEKPRGELCKTASIIFAGNHRIQRQRSPKGFQINVG